MLDQIAVLKYFDKFEAVQKMQQKTITLTPNRRLARHLKSQFCSELITKGLTTWRNEIILPLTTWLANCWQEYNDPRVLLNSHQENLLWQQIIKEELGEEFYSITESIINAHALLTNWQINTSDWLDQTSDDINIFKRLNKKFITYCKNKKLVTVYQLPTLLLPYLQKQCLEITLTGFNDYPPQLQTLIDNLQSLNCSIQHYDPNNYQNSLCKKLSFTKQYDEITTIARWAKQLIIHSSSSKIGIIVANLTELRLEIINIFNKVLGNSENINISAGDIFGSLPIISSALELLAVYEPFNLKTISKILLSPYITGSKIEKSNRALLDFKLKELDQTQFWLNHIEYLAKKYHINIPILLSTLQQAKEAFSQIKNKKLSSSNWVKIFAQILQLLGWPGENYLTETELALTERFTELLQEFASTDLITGKTSYTQALQILQDMANHTVFQPGHKTEAPINILGTLEAAGINFDYLWIMGVDRERWPQAPNPNPFIPIAIQKKFDLPHSSAERELYFSNTLINRFKRSAKKIIFSYTKQIEDRTIEPSYLIKDIPAISITELDLAEFIEPAQKIYYSRKTEELIDDVTLPLTPSELIHGGSRLIEQQSLCPFRAFAEFRLMAKELKQPESGISKVKRGILIHRALEKFWQEIKTHQNLCRLTQASLAQAITTSVEFALGKEKLSQSLYYLEKQCLIRLLVRWLEIEKTRPAFQVVAVEKTVETNLGALQIKLRIDRIDKLTNGSLLLIDYKSGKKLPSIFDWFGKRPKNPQLPLYCVAIDGAQGFAFAQINAESVKFKDLGLNELVLGLKSIDPDSFKNNISWHELITYWHDNLVNLAKDFMVGHAKPQPLSPQICKQCGFNMICRYVPKFE